MTSNDIPTTVGDLDGSRFIWKSTNRGGGGTLSLHLDPGCRHLPEESRRLRARTEFEFRSLCQNCVENVTVSESESESESKSESGEQSDETGSET